MNGVAGAVEEIRNVSVGGPDGAIDPLPVMSIAPDVAHSHFRHLH